MTMIKKEYIKPEVDIIVVSTENLMNWTVSMGDTEEGEDADGFMSKEENWVFTDTDDLDGWEPYRSCLWVEDESE